MIQALDEDNLWNWKAGGRLPPLRSTEVESVGRRGQDRSPTGVRGEIINAECQVVNGELGRVRGSLDRCGIGLTD